MKISLNWLRRYIDLEGLKPEQIATTLTDLGLEVEDFGPVEALDKLVVVGKVSSATVHPNADKLQVCQVDIGSETLTIVCGAPNARQDLTVAVARVGAQLPGDFKIKASKIRGEKSAGMLCSAKELGLGQGDEGILELDSNLDLGKSLGDIYQLNDTVFELGLTPNRSDCLGYLGIARDLAAKLGRKFLVPEISEKLLASPVSTKEKVAINVDDANDCGRFTALYIGNVSCCESPLWMQKQLENSGMRPINLIVDVTNYVMLENSHPIHAYDVRDIEGGAINVRRATEGESLTTIDGQKRSLTSDDIVIADGKKAVGLAGVMGGENSEVKNDTKEIVVEVARFNPQSVRKTSKRHNIHSEASHRFERGVDITKTAYVAQRVASLLQQCYEELGGGHKIEVCSEPVDYYPNPINLSKIALRMDRVRQITGLRILTQNECISYLERLGFQFLDKTDERALFEVPSWRLDIEREVDLIEEVARLHGYENIHNTLPTMEIGGLKEKPLIDFTDECKYSLASQGFSEVISFPFISQADLNNFNIPNDHPFSQTVELQNPLVEDQRFLRTSVLFGLLKAVNNNRKHGTKGVRLFEAARNFYKISPDHQIEIEAWQHLKENGCHVIGKARQDNRPIERNMIGGVIDQPYTSKTWQSSEEKANFFHGKQAAADLLASMGARRCEFQPMTEGVIPWLHPGASAKIVFGDKLVGYVGELHPSTALSFDFSLDDLPIVFELDLEFILLASTNTASYVGSSIKFPPVTRDLAFVVDHGVTHKDFESAFSSFNRKKNLSAYRLFDVYKGENLGPDKKSMAFSLEFQSDKKTLTDKEVEKELNALVEWFGSQLAAEIR